MPRQYVEIMTSLTKEILYQNNRTFNIQFRIFIFNDLKKYKWSNRLTLASVCSKEIGIYLFIMLTS